ncbi:hypothetical protein V1477_003696, partial [Vespula maculifrons]
KNHDEQDLLEVKIILQLKVILLIIKTVLTHHHQGSIKAIIAGLMVSPVTQPPPQLTMKYFEVYNGSAISRNTRGLYRSHNIEQTHSLTKNGVIHQNTRQMRDFKDRSSPERCNKPRVFSRELWEQYSKYQTQEYPMYMVAYCRRDSWGFPCEKSAVQTVEKEIELDGDR